MKRREFITLLGGAAVAWPLAARAQQGGGMRRIGVLMNLAADDPVSQARMNAFLQALQQSGWTDGVNVRIDTRWAAADPERFRRYATELVALAPDVILASASPSVAAVQQASRAVPIVFANVTDPVGQDLSRAWHDPAGTPPGFPFTNAGWRRNGWSSSRRLPLACGGWRCFAMPPLWQGADCWGQSKAWRPRLEWR
jgi:putative ABC transport system substrate-binding protein